MRTCGSVNSQNGAMASDVVAREVVVYGRVQGVFFRASCEQEAERGRLVGWISNESDGSVRAWFEGAKQDVDALCEWCQHGPSRAVVERVTRMNANQAASAASTYGDPEPAMRQRSCVRSRPT